MNTTEQQLLAQIWAQPEDRAALSVYADWLVEQGESTRGQYMQLRLLESPTPEQVRLRHVLLAQHQVAWLGAARPLLTKWSESVTSPGFFSHVTCSAENLVRGFELIRALGPRLHVELEPVWSRATITSLGRLPLGTLYRLELNDREDDWLTDELLAEVGPSLEGLRSLSLFATEWMATVRGWQRVLPYLNGLEQLDLGLGKDPDLWVELLLDWPVVSSLRRLSVPAWIAPNLRAALEEAMAGRELTFRVEERRRYPPPSQPVG